MTSVAARKTLSPETSVLRLWLATERGIRYPARSPTPAQLIGGKGIRHAGPSALLPCARQRQRGDGEKSTTATLMTDNGRHHEVDAMVRVAADAARAFRGLDQEQVDRIVGAMVRAGVRAAPELAKLAIDETGFGVFEDKVAKNYLATEFLADYLRDKKSVGVVDEDVERNIVHVAEPIGVVLAITPVTNPTPTVLYKAIVAAKTRNAVLFRPSPFAVRSCERSVEILREAAEEAGMPRGALQVIPDAANEVTHYLFKHPDVDFIWVTGGPKIVALANSAGKPGLSVGPGNAPIYIHKTADVKGAVVDILISKTLDASMICPAEQTCIVDDEVYDEMLAEFERMGAHLLTGEQTDALADLPSEAVTRST